MTDASAAMFDWDRMAERFRVVRWDARGHGDSDGEPIPDIYRWDRMGHDVVALADALDIETFVLGGVSMGAATALHVAVDEADRVDGLILALPPTGYETRAGQGDLYRAGADLIEAEGFDAYVALIDEAPIPEILTGLEDVYRFVPAVAPELLPSVLRGAADSDLPEPIAVSTIGIPTLILAWDTDPGHPLSTAQRLDELIPNSTLVVADQLADVGTWTDHVISHVNRAAHG